MIILSISFKHTKFKFDILSFTVSTMFLLYSLSYAKLSVYLGRYSGFMTVNTSVVIFIMSSPVKGHLNVSEKDYEDTNLTISKLNNSM